MPENRQYLVARAQWCRRLAQGCADSQVKASLDEMAQDLDRRARAAARRSDQA
jgi:hypothetical protein